MLTRDDELVLAQQDMHTLAVWCCVLNKWDWPDGLPDPENDTLEDALASGGRATRRADIRNWIIEAIGGRAVSREWNSCMNDDEFNDFWRGCYEGHRPSFDRYWQRIGGPETAMRRY